MSKLNRGRPERELTKQFTKKVLRAAQKGTVDPDRLGTTSWYISRIAKQGLLKYQPRKVTPGRGRPRMVPVLTKKGERFLNADKAARDNAS